MFGTNPGRLLKSIPKSSRFVLVKLGEDPGNPLLIGNLLPIRQNTHDPQRDQREHVIAPLAARNLADRLGYESKSVFKRTFRLWRGFVLLPRRWVVERSFAWAARFRRLARDYERLATTLAGYHWLAYVTLLLATLFGKS